MGAEPRSSLSPKWTLLIVIAVACVARLGVYVSASESVYFLNPSLDAATNWQTANLWAFDDGPDRPFFKAPLYPFAASLIITLNGADPELDLFAMQLVVMLQLLLGIGTAICAWHVGRGVAGVAAGLIAGIICGLAGALIHFEYEILDAALVTFLMAMGLALLVKREGESGKGRLIFAGICWALAVATRPTAFAPVFLLALLMIRRPQRSALLLAPVVVGILFIAWLNSFQTPIATYGGPNLWLANHEGADGFTTRVPQIYGDPRDGEDYIERFALIEASRALGHEATGPEADAYWRGRAMRFWQDQPVVALQQTAKRGLLFWQGAEIRNNRSLSFVGQQIPPLGFLMHLVSWYWLAPLGLLGLIIGLRIEEDAQRRAVWMALACLLGLFIATLPFPVTSRYRVTALPFLAVGSGVWVMTLVDLLRRGERGRASVLVAWALGLILFASLDWTRGADEQERWRDWWQLGNAATRSANVERGDWTFAEEAYREALRLRPDHFESQVNLARLLILRGETTEARERLRTLRQEAPGSAVLPTMMAQSHLIDGNTAEARRLLEEALRLDPDHTPARETLDELLADSSN